MPYDDGAAFAGSISPAIAIAGLKRENNIAGSVYFRFAPPMSAMMPSEILRRLYFSL